MSELNQEALENEGHFGGLRGLNEGHFGGIQGLKTKVRAQVDTV